MNPIKAIAIYLPQYHPVPENDTWWEKGFTEWTNVTKAKPLYSGHYQPDLPADLGFYDLRLEEIRIAQAEMAMKYGIKGFCYYHYWFNGRQILEKPFQEIIKSGNPEFPFMLCWANENWTRTWSGDSKEILLEQKYSIEDDRAHIQSLIPYFKDKRYIRIDGKPVISIYQSVGIPNIESLLSIWREEALKEGLELYICRFETFGNAGPKFLISGFDAAIEFEPHLGLAQSEQGDTLSSNFTWRNILKSIQFRINRFILNLRNYLNKESKLEGIRASYTEIKERAIRFYKENNGYKIYRTVCVGFDNSPRKSKNFVILEDANPENFKKWVEECLTDFVPYSPEENLFFINAWNEWAEGNHLEPGRRYGLAHLEALKSVLEKYQE